MAVPTLNTSYTNTPSFEDKQDFEDADRGFVASLKPCIIKNSRGDVLWNNDAFDFVYDQECPDTVNSKLWRQAQLLAKQGLYQVSESIFQVRGFDISHISFVEGRTGVIVVDPLISCECAAAAMKLYQDHRGERPVRAVIYTHSHIDHFGGAAGIIPPSRTGPESNDIPVIAPEHFMEEAVSENIYVGPGMMHRAQHMYGSALPRSPTGQIGVGLGMGTSRGTTSLIPPTLEIRQTGHVEIIDGVEFVFQMVPNTEAPAELNIYFPSERALLIAECATHSMHNIITLRGALVRDAKAWSRYLDESLMLYCESKDTNILFGSHGWPTWGKESIQAYLEEQRDLYGFMHDQTVKQMNEGWNGAEIAERMVMPPRLSQAWHTQGFYGSVSHNVKGIYQRYLTWFDGQAENLWKWPPAEEGERYVECMGGVQALLVKAEEFVTRGDLRFAATLLAHVVAAGDRIGGEEIAKEKCNLMLADVFQSLGFGAENATWRNIYLTQSLQLRNGDRARPPRKTGSMAPFAPGTPVEHWFGALSVRINADLAAAELKYLQVDILVNGANQELWRLILSNSVLTYRKMEYLHGITAPAIAMGKPDLCKILNSLQRVEDVCGPSHESKLLEKILSFGNIGPPRPATSNL